MTESAPACAMLRRRFFQSSELSSALRPFSSAVFAASNFSDFSFSQLSLSNVLAISRSLCVGGDAPLSPLEGRRVVALQRARADEADGDRWRRSDGAASAPARRAL